MIVTSALQQMWELFFLKCLLTGMDPLVLEAVRKMSVCPSSERQCMWQDPVEGRDMQGSTEKVTVLLRSIAVAMAPSKPSIQRSEKKISLFDVLSHMN